MWPMKVVFLAPHYPPEMQQFTRGLAEVGAEVYGVGDQPAGALSPSLKPYLTDYLHVPHMMDEDHVIGRVTQWLRGRSIRASSKGSSKRRDAFSSASISPTATLKASRRRFGPVVGGARNGP